MNKNTDAIRELRETIKLDEETLTLYSSNFWFIKADIDIKETEIDDIDLVKLTPINNFIYEYNQFKKIIHKPTIINYFYAGLFIIYVVPIIKMGSLESFPLNYILAGTFALGFNIIDLFIGHKVVSLLSCNCGPRKFNKKNYEETKREQERLLEIKERLLKDIKVLKEDYLLYQRLISRLEVKIDSNKYILNEMDQERRNRNNIIKANLIKIVSKWLSAMPDYKQIFVEQMNCKGYNVEGLSFEEILTYEDLVLKQQK